MTFQDIQMAASRSWLDGLVSLVNGKPSSSSRHEGFLGFLRDNCIVPIALATGLICSLGVIPYTVFLSHQRYHCPWWAYGCTVFTGRSGTIQGVVTLIYTVGLTCLAYACWALAEISMWPLLCMQPLTLRQIDTYLAVSRGSIPSILAALAIVRRYTTLLFVFWAFMATLTTLSAGPVIGYVLDQPSQATVYPAEIFVGGGNGKPWIQTNPPVGMFDIASAGFFNSWSSDFFTNESMPMFRDWIVDRDTLASRGNFTAKAVRVQKSVTCHGIHLNQTTGPALGQVGEKYQLYFNTNIANALNDYRPARHWNADNVAVVNIARLSGWAHDVAFVSANRTRSTMVFALPGAHLEDSYHTNLTGPQAKFHSFVSAVACDVDVELVDDILVVGDGGIASKPDHGQQQPQLPVLSTISQLTSFLPTKQPPNIPANGHQEFALLASLAPLLCGTSVNGEQPIFAPYSINSTTLLSSVSMTDGYLAYHWTIDQILRLIDVSAGAFLLSSSLTYRDRRVLMDFTVFANRMSPIRNVLLMAPVIVLLTTWVVLAVWTSRLHRRCKMPFMRMCETAEILRACQAEDSTGSERSKQDTLEHLRLRCQTTVDGSPYLRSDMSTRPRDIENSDYTHGKDALRTLSVVQVKEMSTRQGQSVDGQCRSDMHSFKGRQISLAQAASEQSQETFAAKQLCTKESMVSITETCSSPSSS